MATNNQRQYMVGFYTSHAYILQFVKWNKNDQVDLRPLDSLVMFMRHNVVHQITFVGEMFIVVNGFIATLPHNFVW